MKKIFRFKWWRYQFDNLMSKGTGALILALTIISLALVAGIAVLVLLFAPEGHQLGFARLAWMGLLRTLDPGTMGGDQGSTSFLGGMFVVTLGGIFLVSTLIGILSNGIDDRLDELRKGRSLVVETNHTVILGWSAQVFTIVSELVVANQNQPKSCIAILADKDKVEMEDELAAKCGKTGKTRLVCRRGSPMDPLDLEIINPHEARSIIILTPEGDYPDAQAIKTILALLNNPKRRDDVYHVVASIRRAHNMEVAQLVARQEACLILADDLIARITAQTCRQSGLSFVYNELLDFAGDEIYFSEEPTLVGKTFGEALFAYEKSALMGLFIQGQGVKLNPPMDTRLQPGDRIIAISADDNTVIVSNTPTPRLQAEAIRTQKSKPRQKERTLILGWNLRAPTVITELDRYVTPGSEVSVVANVDDAEVILAQNCTDLHNQTVNFRQADTTDRRILNNLAIETYDHVIILSYTPLLSTQEADAQTMITLLHLRDIAEKNGYQFSIVSEMLDIHNRQLVEVARVDDFIVSDRLVSLMLSQVSENRDLMEVFTDLFDPQGSEIYLKPAGDYIAVGQPVNFYTVLEAGRRRNEVAIGYRLSAQANLAEQAYGLVINPLKSAMVTFSENDRVIVLAEE